ncbi:hypothetical protein GIB67_018620 [Kingdonia uniflora]|uniref:Uncharacterized protein n=1 Tax=Kingdonia uniflora TaxID=39325 RepID=A0A7J7M2G3_9MAGN|nr:hypothetical protein GIB67_018620 [Kingdonia uniflora]
MYSIGSKYLPKISNLNHSVGRDINVILLSSNGIRSRTSIKLSVIIMAGLAAEGLEYDKVVGQSADLFTLQRFINRSKPQISKEQQLNLTRWAVLLAGSLLKNNKVAHEALMSAMSNKATVL